MSEDAAPERIAVLWSRKPAPICGPSIARPRCRFCNCLNRYLESRSGDVKELKPPLTGFRLRCGDYRVFFVYRDENAIDISVRPQPARGVPVRLVRKRLLRARLGAGGGATLKRYTIGSWTRLRSNPLQLSLGGRMTGGGGQMLSPCRVSWLMAIREKRRLPLCARWRCGLPRIASSTERTCLRRSRKSSAWHEPMAVRKGAATFGRAASDRMAGGVAERFASSAEALGIGELYVRVS